MTVDLVIGDTDGADPLCPDVYFTAGYGRAAAVAEAGDWQVAYWPERVLVPYVRRRVDDVCADAVSPYGYSGVHVHPGCSPAELARFWSQVTRRWRDAGLVAMFLRFSPLDPASVAAVAGLGRIALTRRADTITVAVDRGAGQVWTGMAGRSRTAIRKARNAGQEATIRPAGRDDLAAGTPFRRLYEQTMARVGSASGYLFADAYYRRLADGLGKALWIAEVRDTAGEVVASALVLRHRDRVHYHLAGSDPGAARDGANNLLLWTILEWAADNGCTWTHLGGGVRPDDGLFQFKRSFGGARTPFWTGGVVLDPARYDALVAARADQLARPVDDVRGSGFFPAYRFGGN